MDEQGYVRLDDPHKYNKTSVCLYDDVVSQHVLAHFVPNHKIPIAGFPDIVIPKSYTDYLQSVMTVLHPYGLISSGTAIMITDVFRDSIGGGYISLDTANDQVEQELSINATRYINQLIKGCETFGQSALVRTDDELSVLSGIEFYYDSTNNIFYSAKAYIYDNEDGYMYEKRYTKKYRGEVYVYVEKYFNDKFIGKTKLFPVTTSTNPLTQMCVSILTNNPYNEDWVGISCLDPIMNHLKGFELTIQEYHKALYFTAPRTFIMSNAVEVDEDGQPILDLVNDVFVAVDGTALDDPKKMIETQQYKFDSHAFRVIIEDSLNIMLSCVGLDRKVMAFNGSGIERSATEVVSEDNRFYATIENRRSQYYSQLKRVIDLITLGESTTVQIRFIPIQSFNMSLVTQVVTQKYGVMLMSEEEAVRQLNPRMSDQQIAVELERIQERKLENQQSNSNNQEQYTSDNYQRDTNGYDTSGRSSGNGYT